MKVNCRWLRFLQADSLCPVIPQAFWPVDNQGCVASALEGFLFPVLKRRVGSTCPGSADAGVCSFRSYLGFCSAPFANAGMFRSAGRLVPETARKARRLSFTIFPFILCPYCRFYCELPMVALQHLNIKLRLVQKLTPLLLQS